MKYLIQWMMLSFVFVQCQYPVSISSLPETEKFLIIDAQVTQDYAAINVYYSLDEVTSKGAYTLPQPPKSVAYLLDDKGERFDFKNTLGIADTTFKGKVGNSYQLFIEANGQVYTSSKETMRPSPKLNNFVRHQIYPMMALMSMHKQMIYPGLKIIINGVGFIMKRQVLAIKYSAGQRVEKCCSLVFHPSVGI